MEEKAKKEVKIINKYRSGGPGAFYGLGFVGALVYYWQHAANFQEGFIAFLKAIVWPAFLIHKVFTLLGM